MPKAYVIHSNGSPTGSSTEMAAISCRNEATELQTLLEKNHNLLAGEQITPDDPRRWLMVSREMSVNDPGTGEDWWSADFLFVDQDAIPTIVECKRHDDTRSRREVIAQMLDYAANGAHYWERTALMESAQRSAGGEEPFRQALEGLHPADLDAIGSDTKQLEQFFSRVRENLENGMIRLIFFLEKSPYELRSIVEFLNKEMIHTEVLIVEAQQYELEGIRIVVPVLFGYTEQARRTKRDSMGATTVAKGVWDEEKFFGELGRQLQSPEQVAAIRSFFEGCKAVASQVTWGSGKVTGTFNVRDPAISRNALLSVTTKGNLDLGLTSLKGPVAERARDQLKELLEKGLGLAVPPNSVWVSYKPSRWIHRAAVLLSGLKQIIEEGRVASGS